jgi:hypothetical protein
MYLLSATQCSALLCTVWSQLPLLRADQSEEYIRRSAATQTQLVADGGKPLAEPK